MMAFQPPVSIDDDTREAGRRIYNKLTEKQREDLRAYISQELSQVGWKEEVTRKDQASSRTARSQRHVH